MIRPVSRTRAGWVIGAMPRPRPLYGLGTLADPGQVFVCEGEPACDALREIGLTATTSSGGSNAAFHSDWTPLYGRNVVLLPDADDAGQRYADTVVKQLRGRATTIKLVDLPDLPEHGDAVDYVAARRAAGAGAGAVRGDLERMADRAQPVDHYQPVIDKFKPFPVEVLPDCLRTFVEAAAAATGTDFAFAALAALVVVAGCVGNRVAAIVKSGWVEPAVLWGVLVGRSGTTKSPVLRIVQRPLLEIYKAERHEFEEALREHQREVERYKTRRREWKESQQGGPPTDPPDEPVPPLEKRVVVSDITIEKLGALLQENPLGLLLIRDELAAWIGAFDRYAAGGKGSDCPAWLSMYDACPVTIDRKSVASALFVERAAVSVLGSIQPRTLARVFGRAEREAGLLARVVLAYPPDRPSMWTEADLPEAVAARWAELIQGLLSIEPKPDEGGAPQPRLIPLGEEAKAIFIAWHDGHARETFETADDDLMAHFAKLKGVCIRIALLLACVDVASGAAVTSIGADAMRRAIRIVEWFKCEARRVYALLSESDEESDQRRLIEWIKRRGGNVTVRDLTHGIRTYRGDADCARAALEGLVVAGLGYWAESAGPGRPTQRFMLVSNVTVTETPSEGSSNEHCGAGGAEFSPKSP